MHHMQQVVNQDIIQLMELAKDALLIQQPVLEQLY